jgi:hypothetical protein
VRPCGHLFAPDTAAVVNFKKKTAAVYCVKKIICMCASYKYSTVGELANWTMHDWIRRGRGGREQELELELARGSCSLHPSPRPQRPEHMGEAGIELGAGLDKRALFGRGSGAACKLTHTPCSSSPRLWKKGCCRRDDGHDQDRTGLGYPLSIEGSGQGSDRIRGYYTGISRV